MKTTGFDSSAKLASLGQPPRLVVIVGETASGKSALALELARAFGGEIICADSWTVRREVNIGTAKPSEAERTEIPHHLLDVVEPCGDFTAAVFKRLANRAISDIAGRGKLPVMVGGTGLYVDGVLYDFSFLPGGGQQRRVELNALKIPQLLEMVKRQKIDLSGVDTANKRRLIRLLETGGARPEKAVMRPNTLVIGLKISRTQLRANIEQRVERMCRRGLRPEVTALVGKYDWDCEGLRGIGYREWRDYFEGRQSLRQTKVKIVQSTLKLAKRQRTWFKRNREIVWVEEPAIATATVEQFLSK